MYTQFFGLREKPFAITPDPRYLYLSQRHADALAHLIYGISHSGGFIQLTGEVGTGKTTLVRTLFEQLPEEADVALILNPELSSQEFLAAILEEFKVPPPEERSVKALVDRLNVHLLDAHARGRRTVLIVDEAQNLARNILEQVRMLTNLETPKQKLLQIILIGQPELRELLAQEDMRQLAQRVTGRYHLEPLKLDDTGKYIAHRLKVAGASGGIFPPSAVKEIYRWSGGIPRLVNVVADRALLAAYTQDTRSVDRRLVRRAAVEVFGETPRRRRARRSAAAIAAAGVVAISFAAWRYGTTPSALSLAAVENVAFDTPVPAEPAAPVELPAPPKHSPPPLAELLADQSLAKDTDAAFAALFELWGADFAAEAESACEQALEQGLRCWYQTGTLSHLRQLDRPAILSLIDAEGGEHQVVLSALGDNTAKLHLGEPAFSVTLGDLSKYWYGDYLILWRPETPTVTTLDLGAEGEDVAWLRRSLATIQGTTLDEPIADRYDNALAVLVREYQRARRLKVDGIVGTQTRIAILSDLATPGSPRLSGEH
jgi:general secretion pathway protein A